MRGACAARGLFVGALIVASAGAAACDSKDSRGINRAPFGGMVAPSSTFATVSLLPQSLIVQPATTFGCLSPVNSQFSIVVQNPSASVQALDMHFIDGSKMGGSIPIPSPGSSSPFGSTAVRAGTFSSFAFTPAFGCIPTTATSLAVNVILVDSGGFQQHMQLTAPIVHDTRR